MRRRLIVLVLGVVALASCSKKKSTSDALPSDDLTREDLLNEQKRVANGETVGEALRAPKIEIDARGVTINARLVASPSVIAARDAGTPPRIEEVRAWLQGLREHWLQIHPGETFGGRIELVAATDTTATLAERVLGSAAISGYARAHVKVGAVEWDAPLWIMDPPLAQKQEAPRAANVTLTRGADGYTIAVTTFGPPCKHTPSVGAGDALRAVLGDHCADDARCYLAIEPSTDDFASVAAILAPAFGFGAPPGVVLDARFRAGAVDPCAERNRLSALMDLMGDPSAPTAPWGRDDPSPNPPLAGSGMSWGAVKDAGAIKGVQVRAGALAVHGRLPPEVIQRIVRQNFGRFRLCYENGLRNNPSLAGRVAVRFVIDRKGEVTLTADGGSDLPDNSVVACVVRAFGSLSFPAPEGGIVTVVSPLMFSHE